MDRYKSKLIQDNYIKINNNNDNNNSNNKYNNNNNNKIYNNINNNINNINNDNYNNNRHHDRYNNFLNNNDNQTPNAILTDTNNYKDLNINNRLFNRKNKNSKNLFNKQTKRSLSLKPNIIINENEDKNCNDNKNNINNKYKSERKKKYIYKLFNYASFSLEGTNGNGKSKINQASFIIKQNKTNEDKIEYIFGVFDGHGTDGHLVSDAIYQFFNKISFYEIKHKSNILSLFSKLSKKINNSKKFDSIESGSTVVLIYVNSDKIISINCGDSRAILITNEDKVIPLTTAHKPELLEEKTRIESSGGRVDKEYKDGPYRVFNKNGDIGLEMSRCIGDQLAHSVGVSDIPEIKKFNISDMEPLAIVIASDGIWKYMTHEEVLDIVTDYKNRKFADECSKDLVKKARSIGEKKGFAIDDITCIVAYFKGEFI